MITQILALTGRVVVSFGASLPLGDRLVDRRFEDEESEHVIWGLGFYVGLALTVVSLLAWKH